MKIKHLLTFMAICAVFSVPVQAQEELETRHEIGISYGAVPNSVWIDILTEVVPAIFGESHDNNRYVGPIGLEYYYHTSPLIGVGAVGVFATNNEDAFRNKKMTAHINKSYTTLMPSVKFNWLRKEKWGMYSKLAAGATLAHSSHQDYNENSKLTGEKETSNDVFFNFQASLLGVEVGSAQVRGFFELGLGEQGIALAGVRYKF